MSNIRFLTELQAIVDGHNNTPDNYLTVKLEQPSIDSICLRFTKTRKDRDTLYWSMTRIITKTTTDALDEFNDMFHIAVREFDRVEKTELFDRASSLTYDYLHSGPLIGGWGYRNITPVRFTFIAHLRYLAGLKTDFDIKIASSKSPSAFEFKIADGSGREYFESCPKPTDDTTPAQLLDEVIERARSSFNELKLQENARKCIDDLRDRLGLVSLLGQSMIDGRRWVVKHANGYEISTEVYRGNDLIHTFHHGLNTLGNTPASDLFKSMVDEADTIEKYRVVTAAKIFYKWPGDGASLRLMAKHGNTRFAFVFMVLDWFKDDLKFRLGYHDGAFRIIGKTAGRYREIAPVTDKLLDDICGVEEIASFLNDNHRKMCETHG